MIYDMINVFNFGIKTVDYLKSLQSLKTSTRENFTFQFLNEIQVV